MRTDFHSTIDRPVSRLRIAGELDLSTRDRLADTLACLRRSQCSRIEVDVTDVTFVDAASLRVLHQEQRRVLTAGGELEVVAASPAYQLLVTLAGYPALRPACDRDPERSDRRVSFTRKAGMTRV